MVAITKLIGMGNMDGRKPKTIKGTEKLCMGKDFEYGYCIWDRLEVNKSHTSFLNFFNCEIITDAQ